MSELEIEIGPGETSLAAGWRDLLQRAEPNAFMDPAALAAIHETGYAKVHVLAAWDRSRGGRTLVGLWALAEKSVGPFAYLSGPPHQLAHVSSPVIAPGMTEAVTTAFFDAIRRHPKLPKIVRLKYLDGEQPSSAAIAAAAGSHNRVLSDKARAYATRESGLKRSGSTRKKLRQEWNRLSAVGAVDIVNAREPVQVQAAFEAFLIMEVKSWKGANGTALLSNSREAAFARAMIRKLAEAGHASVALLRLDGRPIATQVLLYCGTTAYTWKIAYAAAYDRHSPGALLVDKVTEQLFAAGGMEAIESCSPEGGFMETIWTGRRRTVDLLVDLTGHRSPTFFVVMLGAFVRGVAKKLRPRFNAWLAPRRSQPKPAMTPSAAPAPEPAAAMPIAVETAAIESEKAA